MHFRNKFKIFVVSVEVDREFSKNIYLSHTCYVGLALISHEDIDMFSVVIIPHHCNFSPFHDCENGDSDKKFFVLGGIPSKLKKRFWIKHKLKGFSYDFIHKFIHILHLFNNPRLQ
jgi:hypothetical protein